MVSFADGMGKAKAEGAPHSNATMRAQPRMSATCTAHVEISASAVPRRRAEPTLRLLPACGIASLTRSCGAKLGCSRRRPPNPRVRYTAPDHETHKTVLDLGRVSALTRTSPHCPRPGFRHPDRRHLRLTEVQQRSRRRGLRRPQRSSRIRSRIRCNGFAYPAQD